jgi:hypothetical protein
MAVGVAEDDGGPWAVADRDAKERRSKTNGGMGWRSASSEACLPPRKTLPPRRAHSASRRSADQKPERRRS